MAKKKINVDIEDIKRQLIIIGYEISHSEEKENNGKYWEIVFKNRKAIVIIYETGTVDIGGPVEVDEKEGLKKIIKLLIANELNIHPLNEEIVNLIKSGKEDIFYDLKKGYPSVKGLIHDILCLSNNLKNKESYLIIGVEDGGAPFKKGENDDDLILLKSPDFFSTLNDVEFAGEHKPEIEFEEMYYLHTKIQVIICRKSNRVPFYLSKDYGKAKTGLIYTRRGDTNTPSNEIAKYDEVEKLWRIHFGLN